MKNMIRGILLLSVLFAIPVAYGQAPKGVAGVVVAIKQNPTNHLPGLQAEKRSSILGWRFDATVLLFLK